jgi:hypothetical protein
MNLLFHRSRIWCLGWHTGVIDPGRKYRIYHTKFRATGAFFTGDIPASTMGIENFIRTVYVNYLPLVGIIQIPHHGAKDGASEVLVPPECHAAVVQYGSLNGKYHHPSAETLGLFQKHGIQPVHVTEFPCTYYCECCVKIRKTKRSTL